MKLKNYDTKTLSPTGYIHHSGRLTTSLVVVFSKICVGWTRKRRR